MAKKNASKQYVNGGVTQTVTDNRITFENGADKIILQRNCKLDWYIAEIPQIKTGSAVRMSKFIRMLHQVLDTMYEVNKDD